MCVLEREGMRLFFWQAVTSIVGKEKTKTSYAAVYTCIEVEERFHHYSTSITFKNIYMRLVFFTSPSTPVFG